MYPIFATFLLYGLIVPISDFRWRGFRSRSPEPERSQGSDQADQLPQHGRDLEGRLRKRIDRAN